METHRRSCFLLLPRHGVTRNALVGAMYDVAVVGAGLIGAAAAKYLAKKGLKVEAGLSKSQWFIGKKENTGFRNSRVGKLPILNKLASL